MTGIQRLLRKLRNEERGNEGFSLVELLLVLAISAVIMAGVIVMLSGTFDVFKSNRNLLSITDSSRKSLSAMARQLRGALHFVNGLGNTDAGVLTFYADVKGDQYFADVYASPNWENAPKVKWEFDANAGIIKQTTTEPGTDPPVISNLASDVKELKFDYYAAVSNIPFQDPQESDINKYASRVRITVTVQKGNSSRTYYQDVFLRVLNRVPEESVILISSVTPREVSHTGTFVVTIVGANTNFVQGQTVVAFVPSKLWLTIDNVTVVSRTELTVTVTVSAHGHFYDTFDVYANTVNEKPFPKINGFLVD